MGINNVRYVPSMTITLLLKQSRYRPGVAQSVSGS